MNNIISSAQSGGQRGRSTLDNLLRLEDNIRTAYASKEKLLSIFFDLEKAYDMAWRDGIVIDLYKAGLRGLFPRYIAVFLGERTFRVKVGSSLSSVHHQQNGVPQGSVLSVPLFILKLNGITQLFPRIQRFSFSLFVDYLQIGFRHPSLHMIQIKQYAGDSNQAQHLGTT